MDIQLVQEMLTYVIVAGAVFVAGYKIVTALAGKKAANGSCGTECSGCSAIEVKKKAHNSRMIHE